MNVIKLISISILAISLTFADGTGKAKSQKKANDAGKGLSAQTKCPVMGGDIDKSLYVDKDGKRIYMCCEHCRKELTDTFDENVKKLADKGQKPETLGLVMQTTCPVMGGDIDKSLYVDKGGKRIYMCCEHCRKELTDTFDENVKKLEEKGQKPELL